MKLPKWVADNRAAVLDEVAEYIDMTDERRDEILRSVMRVGARQLAERDDRGALLAFRDPLPKSSIALLERLRRQYRANRGRAA